MFNRWNSNYKCDDVMIGMNNYFTIITVIIVT